MKKIGKKLSFLTKVFLILGLLFSNLSSLSVVFAYEGNDDFTVKVEDKKIVINYLSELEDEIEVEVSIIENYTYLDNFSETSLSNSYMTDGATLTSTQGFEIASSMLNGVLFDGLYELRVLLHDTTNEVDLGTVSYSSNVSQDEGLTFQVFDVNTMEEILPVDGKYSIEDEVIVKSKILAGGLKPTDVYEFDGTEYTAEEVLGLTFNSEMELNLGLFGEFSKTIEIKGLDNDKQEVSFTKDINYQYGEYKDNGDVLNSVLEEMEMLDKYYFYTESEDGVLEVIPNGESGYSVNDLFKVLDDATEDTEINYIIGNSESEDLMSDYLNYIEESEENISMEDYFLNIYIDNSTYIVLYDENVVISFYCIVIGDMNDDSIINESDVEALINQSLGLEDENLLNGDLYTDEVINELDVITLYQILKTNDWDNEIDEDEINASGNLEIDSEDIVSGDEFTVSYNLEITEDNVNGLAGEIQYDEDMLELISIDTENDSIGNNNNNKFMFVGEELVGNSKPRSNHKVVVFTFRALQSGSTEISLINQKLFNDNVYYDASLVETKTTVLINASSDSTLSSLTVSGTTIELQEDVFDYEIEVENSNTSTDIEAITNSITARILSIAAPEELAVGENEIVITVMAENGDELIYTVKVIRKEAPKEENTTSTMNYQEDNSEEDNVVLTVDNNEDKTETTQEDDSEEDNSLSRIVIIILILLVIAGLIYLIFKDDDEETKKANKEINKLKKENTLTSNKPIKEDKVNKNNSTKTKGKKNNYKKER